MGEEESTRLLELLKQKGVDYELHEHRPVYTSAEASMVRGVDLKTGVKAMVLKKKFKLTNGEATKREGFVLADIAADRRLDFKKLEMLFDQVRKLEFARKEEVISVTGCEPGSVHPVGWLFGLDSFLDVSVLENEFVNFNIGLLTKSVRIRKDDLIRILEPKAIIAFSKP
jgi:Ala-tRNA(Pro) deacylase